jgi:DNA polymerase elongation subunit (family B)
LVVENQLLQSSDEQLAHEDLAEKLSRLTAPVSELEEGMLVSATYDGDKRVAVLKFYDPKLDRVWLWEDNTGHKPYCYCKLPRNEVLSKLAGRNDITSIDEVQKADLLSDSRIMVRKIVATDPLAIGGQQGRSIRDIMDVWEGDIKYYENYVYDNNLRVGTYYRVSNGNISPLEKAIPETVARSLDQILSKNSGEQVKFINAWADLLGQPLCSFKRIATDIEVANEESRIPDPEKADREVIAISFHNESESLVYLVARKEGDRSLDGAKTPYKALVFPDEAAMIRGAFSKMMDYPFLLTFNGDDFDLRYLKHRAEKLGVKEEEIPIALQRQEASLKHGVHIDLYRFFNNRSIQVYVYGNKYAEHTLNGISEAILGKSKIEFEGNVADLPLLELANYCLNDSQLTFELTYIQSSLLMKILLVISRIAKMPMNDVARLGVSNWIRSMLFYEHRSRDAIIPRQDELKVKGGASSEAIIKGKKYKGGLVIEPKPGVHFGVSVLDFASLYPSIIKVHNLSYETVNCPHEECRSNRVPDTDNWVCTKRSGITSLVIGSLRDLRVGHYKHLAKDKSLSQEERELSGVVSQGLKVILNACFTPDTMIVTPSGIKRITEMRVGDKVVNVNPETLVTEIDEVIQVQQFPYNGDLYHFENSRFVDLMVTPNHRFLVKDHRAKSRFGTVFRTAEELLNRTNMTIPKLVDGIQDSPALQRISLLETAIELGATANIFAPPAERLSNFFRKLPSNLREKLRKFAKTNKNKSKIDPNLHSYYRLSASRITERDVDAVEEAGGFVLLGTPRYSKIPALYDAIGFASLCGWFVSEGNLIETKPKFYGGGAHRGRSSGVVISQSFGKGNSMGIPNRSEIRSTINQLGLSPRTDSGDKKYFRVSNNILHSWMLKNCYVAESLEHHASSKRVPGFVFGSRKLMESFFSSCYKGDGSLREKKYTTSSLQLANDLVVLLSLLGAKTKISYDQTTHVYRVVFRNVSSKLTYSGKDQRKYVKKIPYDGLVYCVTTKRNHTVVAGRNGKFVPVGQSYGVFGFETFALYCLPVAEATAAFGRDAITKTIEKCNQEGVSVIYSDSVTGERCVTLLDPAGVVQVEPVDGFFARFKEPWRREDGKEEVHPIGWKALSFNQADGRVEWKNVKAVIRHKAGKAIYRVRDKFGGTRVTEDHSIVATGSSGPVLAKPNELSDKHLLRVASLPEVRPIETIDLFEILRRVNYRVRYKGRWKTMEAHADEESVWFLWTNRKHPVRLKRFIKVGSLEFIALVELLGAYVAEGSSSTPETTSSRLGASIACSDMTWLQKLQDNYNSLFNGAVASIVESYPGTRDLTYHSSGGELLTISYSDRTHKLQMMNSVSAVFFKALCGQKSSGKQLPDFIFHVPDEYKLLLLENMIKGDGSRVFGKAYSDEYRKRNFKYETKSLRLISGLSTLLLQMGINHTVGYRPSKQTYSIATCTTHNRTRKSPSVQREPYDGYVYDLSVEDFHTFVDACGSIVLKNTDSLFIENPNKEKIDKVISWAEHDLGVELEIDKSYRYVAFSDRKKNYFGVLQDGTADIKGLTGKKSQTPEFLKSTFYQSLDILGRVYAPEDFEHARSEIKTLLTQMVAKLRNKEVSLDDLAFNVMIGKAISGYSGTTPQHVKAANLMQNSGKEIKAGDIISFVKTKTPLGVKPVSLARVEEVDVDKYLEYASSMFDQMLDSLGFTFDEFMGSTTLDAFWS